MIVAKFGGTSVTDASAMRRVASIIRARVTERPLVLVSALAGVTDTLLRMGGTGAQENLSFQRGSIHTVVTRHATVANDLDAPAAVMDRVQAEQDTLLQILEDARGRGLQPNELDQVVGYGEIWSSLLVEVALAAEGVDAVWVDVRPAMRTDERYTRATPDRDAIAVLAPQLFQPLLDAGKVPVTQGFIGSTAAGKPTTLGRGGSDFSATLLGAALGADRVEIWTDVDGLMTADPRLVSGARTLERASYEETAELATFGAKVLHPATQQPLVERDIPIVILNSRGADRAGTTISSAAITDQVGIGPIRSISCKRGITVINVRAARMLGAFGYLRKLFQVFERHEVSVDVLASSEVSVSLTIEDESPLAALVADLEALGEVTVAHDRAIVAVIGQGLRTTPGVAARLFGAIADTNIEVISQGASAINVTFVVQEADAPSVVRKLHDEFFGEG